MYCRNCGNELHEGDTICDKCGAEIPQEELMEEEDTDVQMEGTQRSGLLIKNVLVVVAVGIILAALGCRRSFRVLFGDISSDDMKITTLDDMVYDGFDTESFAMEQSDAESSAEAESGIEVVLDDFDVDSVKVEHPDADEYYDSHSEVLEKIPVKESANVMTEKEVLAFLEARGFTDMPVTWSYDMDGKYMDENETTETDVKHPIYETYYMPDDENAWTISVIDGMIMANPFSYNWVQDKGAPVMVSESETCVSYDNQTNQFYHGIPDKEVITVMVVDRIDAESLNKLTAEDFEALLEN